MNNSVFTTVAVENSHSSLGTAQLKATSLLTQRTL